jgi:AhpD family alkylhydroperoxidase
MTMSEPRLTYAAFEKAAPAAKAALLAMGRAVDESGLDKSLVELVKLRVSQINNCAFCLQIHLNVARRLGLAAEKIDLVATWEEAGVLFSEKERAALAWAEALAHLPGRSVSDEAHASAREHFSEDELMWLSIAVANINAWNRLGAAYRFTPPLPKKMPAAA